MASRVRSRQRSARKPPYAGGVDAGGVWPSRDAEAASDRNTAMWAAARGREIVRCGDARRVRAIYLQGTEREPTRLAKRPLEVDRVGGPTATSLTHFI
jgi:hypothetical protein